MELVRMLLAERLVSANKLRLRFNSSMVRVWIGTASCVESSPRAVSR